MVGNFLVVEGTHSTQDGNERYPERYQGRALRLFGKLAFVLSQGGESVAKAAAADVRSIVDVAESVVSDALDDEVRDSVVRTRELVAEIECGRVPSFLIQECGLSCLDERTRIAVDRWREKNAGPLKTLRVWANHGTDATEQQRVLYCAYARNAERSLVAYVRQSFAEF